MISTVSHSLANPQDKEILAAYKRVTAERDQLLPQNQYVLLTPAQLLAVENKVVFIQKQINKSGQNPKSFLQEQFGLEIKAEFLPASDALTLKIAAVASFFPEGFIKRLVSHTPSALINIRVNPNSSVDAMVGPLGVSDCRRTECYIELASYFEALPATKMFSTLAHELSHLIHATRPDLIGEWRELSGWNEIESYNNSDQPREDGFNSMLVAAKILASRGLVSNYATEKWWEDFAETANAYCFQRAFLQATAPTKFVFMRDRVFQGQSCQWP